MKYVLTISRYKREEKKEYFEDFIFDTDNENETVITALKKINSQEIIINAKNEVTTKIEFECACIQKKCGACAMVINGIPKLACDAKLKDYKKNILIEPLKKFNRIADLIVDREILYENLKTLKLWLEKDSNILDKRRELNYKASECLLCGICLEVCPNFYLGSNFFGMPSIILTTRLLTELDKEDRKIISKLYSKHCFEGCGKSLACKNRCPKKIETDKMLVNGNLLAIWKRK